MEKYTQLLDYLLQVQIHLICFDATLDYVQRDLTTPGPFQAHC